MKHLLLAAVFLASPALAENCRMQETSQMTSKRVVGEVVGLVKNKSHNQCQVKYSITVDGKSYPVEWTQKGLYQEEILCQMAIQNGTNDLLVRLPGNFQTETVMVCKEKPAVKSIYNGYVGNENEFGRHPMNRNYLKIGQASNCRFFMNWTANGYSERSEGVICENRDNLWTVVDKFRLDRR
jgi:hypothetical protein